MDEEMLRRIAFRIEDAAAAAKRAADRMEESAQKLEHLFADGFGGNGLRLLYALENSQAEEAKDAARYRLIRLHTAPAELAQHLGIACPPVTAGDNTADIIDNLIDTVLNEEKPHEPLQRLD